MPIEATAGCVNAEILASDRACIMLELWGRAWVATPLKPSEMDGVASYPEGSGATDWVLRSEG